MPAADHSPRADLLELIAAIEPWDDLERAHQADAIAWITAGAQLYRTRKPNTPPKHLVSYFVVCDELRGQLLLVAHRKSGLWLPSGGHVEPLEDPWQAVVRECREELFTTAVPSRLCGDRPYFLTVTETRGQESHTDVSLWYVLASSAEEVTSFDAGEFAEIKWLTTQQVLNQPLSTLDPHMHRFTHKLRAAAS